MIDKRLWSVSRRTGLAAAMKVASQWVSLLADIGFVYAVVGFLGSLVSQIDRSSASAVTFGVMNSSGREAETGAAFNAFPDDISAFVLAFVVVMLIKYCAVRITRYCGTKASEQIKLTLREQLYAKMLDLGPSYRQQVNGADVVRSAGAGIDAVQRVFESLVPQLCFAVVAPLTLFVVELSLNAPGAWVGFVCAVIVVLVVWLMPLHALAPVVMNAVAYCGGACGIAMAFWQYAQGRISMPAALIASLLSCMVIQPIHGLASCLPLARQGKNAADRIFALLDVQAPKRGAQSLPGGADNVEVVFDGVGYDYDKVTSHNGRKASVGDEADEDGADEHVNVAALHDVSFAAKSGQLTALVGDKGAGKSTAALLMAGTYTGYTGSVRLNYSVLGRPGRCEVNDASVDSIVSMVAVVSADDHLFEGTLRDNLLMANAQAGANDMWLALSRARIDGFIYRQRDGLDMRIECGGSNLTPGQRQRIVLARAVLRDSKVYVFDDIARDVDLESEQLMLAAIRKLARTKTVIMVTRKLSDVVAADQIVVFDGGTVAETGTHGELIEARGLYATMFRNQSEAVQNSGGVGDGSAQAVQSGAKANEGGDVPGHTSAPASIDVDEMGGGSAGAVVPAADPKRGAIGRFVQAVGVFLAGTVGHLSEVFLLMGGVLALVAQSGHPWWQMDAGPALSLMAVCALLCVAMRWLGSSRLVHPGGARVNRAVALVSSVVLVVVMGLLNVWCAVLLVLLYLVAGVLFPRVHDASVRGIKPRLKRHVENLDAAVLDDMQGLNEITRFQQGGIRLKLLAERSHKLWLERGRMSRRVGIFEGMNAVLAMISVLGESLLALMFLRADGAGAVSGLLVVVLTMAALKPAFDLRAVPTRPEEE